MTPSGFCLDTKARQQRSVENLHEPYQGSFEENAPEYRTRNSAYFSGSQERVLDAEALKSISLRTGESMDLLNPAAVKSRMR